MAGIYIHIPYCRTACYYCNFHFSTTLKHRDEMVAAIIKELDMRHNYLPTEISTIYFGGGTPSLLETAQIGQLLEAINKHYHLQSGAEVTLEANPEDITPAKAKALRALGINRASLGVQSFADRVLKTLNRQHSSKQAMQAIHHLRQAGIDNLTIDLIYGIPDQGQTTWIANVDKVVELGIPHISAYALTIEERTVFGHRLRKGELKPVKDKAYYNEYEILCKRLAGSGFEHYEVSNFALPGFESRHNSSYWQGAPYLGLGPGAHSFNGDSRQFNVSNNARYLRLVDKGEPAFEEEILSSTDKFNEYLLTGLRTNKGIDLAYIRKTYGIDLLKKHQDFINQCLTNKQALLTGNRFVLTDESLILADSFILEFMLDD